MTQNQLTLCDIKCSVPVSNLLFNDCIQFIEKITLIGKFKTRSINITLLTLNALHLPVLMNTIDIHNTINKVYNGMNCIPMNPLLTLLIELSKENKYKFDSALN